jgi:hypothetical protein
MRKSISLESKTISVESFLNESDKGCVISVASVLEETLRRVHEAHIAATVPDAKTSYSALFESPYAPLASFNGVIELGYAYGLISTEDYRDLNVVRKIRNEAAHSLVEFSLDDRGVKSLVGRLKAVERHRGKVAGIAVVAAKESKLTVEQVEVRKEALKKLTETRWDFMNQGISLYYSLLNTLEQGLQLLLKRRERETAEAKASLRAARSKNASDLLSEG